MRGLLVKDLYMISGFRKQYTLVLLFMGGWSFFMKSFSFLAMYAIILGGMMTLTLTSMDEAVHFNRYALTMPISVRTLVKEKYVMTCLCIATGSLFALAIESAAMLVSWHEGAAEWIEMAALSTFFLVAYTVSIPVIFKYGVEKARYIYMGIMIVMAAVVVGCIYLTKSTHVIEFEGAPSGLAVAIFLGILLLIDVVVVSVSYRVSLRIVKDKEW